MFLALENQLSDHYATIEASFLIHGLRVHNDLMLMIQIYNFALGLYFMMAELKNCPT